MVKRPGRRKHVPQRSCIACRAARPKKDLVRIVRTSDGSVVVDETGKLNGRGAYLCRQRCCWDSALAKNQVERALKTKVTAETRAQLREHAAGLPPRIGTGSEGID